MSATAWPTDGKLQGRYQLQKLLGRGGMGAVFLARDSFLGRDVAVKIFRASTDDSFRQQEDEVNVLASLSHRSLVTLFDAAVDRSDPMRPRIYFVMELIDGTDLKQRLAEPTRLNAREVAQIGHDIAEGLAYIHRRGVVHRDVKPANILLVSDPEQTIRSHAKLTDFGIALRNNDDRSTAEGLTTGTAAYLSPEQVSREPLGPPSDIYSLGLALLECFTTELAFPGDPQASAIARIHRDPAIPHDLSSDWRHLISSMTSKHPDDRPSAGDVEHALQRIGKSDFARHRTAGVPEAHSLPLHNTAAPIRNMPVPASHAAHRERRSSVQLPYDGIEKRTL